MLRQAFLKVTGNNPKTAVVSLVLVANAFVWYIFLFDFMGSVASNRGVNDGFLPIVGINFLGVIASALLSSALKLKFQSRLKFLLVWMIVGVFLSPLPLILNVTTYSGLMIVALIMGAYFGFGFPTVMGFFSASTEAGNRAKLSGIVILLIGVAYPVLKTVVGSDAVLASLCLILWRLSGLVILVLLKPTEKITSQENNLSYKSIISNKSFLLYFIPWAMFSLVNDLTLPVVNNIFPSNLVFSPTMVENVLAGIFAVAFGFFADVKGRKRLILVGFVLLGLGYAALGFFPGNPVGFWFYTVSDGIAWGAFSAMFLLTIWGDIADKKDAEKFYILGFIPYLLSNFTRYSLGAYMVANVTESAVFSFASFFLFVAVLPLFYAPETLPEKHMKERELKNYLDKAKKIASKESEKKPKQEKTKDQEIETEAIEAKEGNSKEQDEARKLAEKYY